MIKLNYSINACGEKNRVNALKNAYKSSKDIVTLK